MKLHIIKSVAIAALLGFALNAHAQRGTERVFGKRDSTPAASMNCPACKDIVSSVRDTSAKGAAALKGADSRKVAAHTCKECKTEIKTEGVGRNASRVANHLCASCAK